MLRLSQASSEADLLHHEVAEFVLENLGVDINSCETVDEVIDSLVWYWSR